MARPSSGRRALRIAAWLLVLSHVLVPGVTAVSIGVPNVFRALRTHGHPTELGLPVREVATERVHGWFLPRPDTQRVALVCHGRSRDKSWMLPLAARLFEAGWSVLLFDFRSHGARGFGTTSIGLRESDDVLSALDWLEAGGHDRVAVYGVSMGGAASLIALGREARPSVRAVAIDGSFPALTDLLEHNAGRWPVPGYLVDWGIAAAGAWAGYDPAAVRPVDAVPEVRAPLLFLQGHEDWLVPPDAAATLAAAAPGGPPPTRYRGGHDEPANAEMTQAVLTFFAERIPP